MRLPKGDVLLIPHAHIKWKTREEADMRKERESLGLFKSGFGGGILVVEGGGLSVMGISPFLNNGRGSLFFLASKRALFGVYRWGDFASFPPFSTFPEARGVPEVPNCCPKKELGGKKTLSFLRSRTSCGREGLQISHF